MASSFRRFVFGRRGLPELRERGAERCLLICLCPSLILDKSSVIGGRAGAEAWRLRPFRSRVLRVGNKLIGVLSIVTAMVSLLFVCPKNLGGKLCEMEGEETERLVF